MSVPPNHNFAARLLDPLGKDSSLIEASSGNTFSASEISAQIGGFATRFLAAGLRAGDRLILSCGINPISALAYLGAMYVGLVPVLLDERTHAASGHLVSAKVRAKAVWSAKPVRQDWALERELPVLEGGCAPVDLASIESFLAREDDLAA